QGALRQFQDRQAVRHRLVPRICDRHAQGRRRRHLRRAAVGQGPHGEPPGRSDVGADPRRAYEEPGMIEGAAALLRWYVEQGVDEAIGEEPIDRFAAPPPPAAAVAVTPIAPAAPRAPPPLPAAPRGPVPLESPQLVEDARTLAEGCSTLAELEAAIRGFEGCAL